MTHLRQLFGSMLPLTVMAFSAASCSGVGARDRRHTARYDFCFASSPAFSLAASCLLPARSPDTSTPHLRCSAGMGALDRP